MALTLSLQKTISAAQPSKTAPAPSPAIPPVIPTTTEALGMSTAPRGVTPTSPTPTNGGIVPPTSKPKIPKPTINQTINQIGEQAAKDAERREIDAIESGIDMLVKETNGKVFVASPPSNWADKDPRTKDLTPKQRAIFNFAPPPNNDPTGSTAFALNDPTSGGDIRSKRKAYAYLMGITYSPKVGQDAYEVILNPMQLAWAYQLQHGTLNTHNPSLGDVAAIVGGVVLSAVPGLQVAGIGLIGKTVAGMQGEEAAASAQAQSDTAKRLSQEYIEQQTQIQATAQAQAQVDQAMQDSKSRWQKFVEWVNSHLYIISPTSGK